MSVHVKSTDFVGTPFNAGTAPLNINQRWVAWDRYHIVDTFMGFDAEYLAIRNSAATIDMSPLGKYDIIGPDAERFLDYLVTRDMSGQLVGQIYYSPWCNENGKTVGDGMIFRLEKEQFRISTDPQYHWFTQQARGFDIEIIDITPDYGILALQGPKSQLVLEASTGEDWSDLAFSRIRHIEVDGFAVTVMRQGFTGEHGYELWVENEGAMAVWDAVYQQADRFGLQPAGFHAHDVARMEAGLLIVGPDYTGAGTDTERGAAIEVERQDERSPYEMRLGNFVHLDKADFVGKEALRREKETGTARNMRGLLIDWEGIAGLCTKQGLPPVVVPVPIWYPLDIIENRKSVGRATSIAWSPAANSIAGFAFIDVEYSDPGTKVSVEFEVGSETGLVNATVADLPFIGIKRAG